MSGKGINIEENIFESRVATAAQTIIDEFIELFALVLAENNVPYDSQAERLNKVAEVLLNPIFSDTIFDQGRRIALKFDGDVLELNKELLSRTSDTDLLQAFADPISTILEVSQLNISLLFQSDERFRKNIALRLKRAKKEFVKATEIESFVTSRIHVFLSRINGLTNLLVPSQIPLETDMPDLSSMTSWPDWDQIQELSFTQKVNSWLENAFSASEIPMLISLAPKLIWDSLSLTKQSALKSVGQDLRALSLSEELSERILSAFASVLFSSDEGLCLQNWTAFEDVVNAYTKVVRRERQLFGVAWDSDIGELKITRSAGDLFGFSEPSELPWSAPVVCWSQREIKALRDLLIGVNKTLPSHVLVPFREAPSISNDLLEISGDLPAVGIQLGFPTASTPSYDHDLSSTALNAARNLIVSKFFELNQDEKLEIVHSMRTTLEEQYARADMIWKRRFHKHEKLGLEKKFVDLVDAFRPLMDLPVLFDPFRSPDLAQIVTPTPVFVLGVNDTPFQFSFGVPVPAILATKNGSAIRIRIVKVSTEKKALWWGDRSVHISKLEEQSIASLMDATLGGGLTFIFTA